MATETKSSNSMKMKASSSSSSKPSNLIDSKPKIESSAQKKKFADGSIKNSSSASASASDIKNRSNTNSSKTVKKTTTQTVTKTKTREKKVYSLAGQKFDVPEEREPLRIFYESLSKQIPSSEMAEFWLMEHGMLSPDRAKKAYEKKQRKQKQIRMGTPIKSPPPYVPNKPESSKRAPPPVPKNGEVKAKKRIMNDSDDEDDDFVLSHKRRKG
ncbi:hypothetical protein ABFX02_01G020400 [Erythranthe guttata]